MKEMSKITKDSFEETLNGNSKWNKKCDRRSEDSETWTIFLLWDLKFSRRWTFMSRSSGLWRRVALW